MRLVVYQKQETMHQPGVTIIMFADPASQQVVMTTTHPNSEAASFEPGRQYDLHFTPVVDPTVGVAPATNHGPTVDPGIEEGETPII
jgi:hypothetical protein